MLKLQESASTIQEVHRLWTACYGRRFDLTEKLLAQRLRSEEIEEALSVIDSDLVLIAKRPPPFKDSRLLFLAMLAFREREVAIDRIRALLASARSREYVSVVFGQDIDHILPGCPVECSHVADVLTRAGFEPGGLVVDLERDLRDYETPVLSPRSREYDMRAAKPSEQSAVLEFLDQEFAGRWRYDAERKLAVDADSAFVLCSDDRVRGFAILQHEGQQLAMGGAVWQQSLGSNWGALGPIGIAKELRGQGWGDALLSAALTHLKEGGVHRCIIDWTAIPRFYERHGFATTRSYRTFRADISMLPK